jgi:hypothetical protein
LNNIVFTKRKPTTYTDQENKLYKKLFGKNLLSKIESDNLIIEPALQTTIESVINEMPIKTNEKKLDYNATFKQNK